jgi:hypothetical protein
MKEIIIEFLREHQKELEQLIKSISIDVETENHKKFASWNVKFLLLDRSLNFLQRNGKGVNCLLDLASGRGNDVNRWITLRIPKVIGIEYSQSQINEAIKIAKTKNKLIRLSYVLGSMIDNKIVKDAMLKFNNGAKVNLITNNFAMNHVAYGDGLHKLMKIVSDNLNYGGLFVGTATDGDIIEFLFDVIGPKVDNKLYYIEKIGADNYKFKINTPFFKKDDEFTTIQEYIINKKQLTKIAANYDLYPFTTISGVDPLANLCQFPEIINEQTGQHYKKSIGISSLYFAFSFIKHTPINYDYEIIPISSTHSSSTHSSSTHSSFLIFCDEKPLSRELFEFLLNPIIYYDKDNDEVFEPFVESEDPYMIIIHRELLPVLGKFTTLVELLGIIKNINVPYVIRNKSTNN